jgi:hypothetical protein
MGRGLEDRLGVLLGAWTKCNHCGACSLIIVFMFGIDRKQKKNHHQSTPCKSDATYYTTAGRTLCLLAILIIHSHAFVPPILFYHLTIPIMPYSVFFLHLETPSPSHLMMPTLYAHHHQQSYAPLLISFYISSPFTHWSSRS